MKMLKFFFSAINSEFKNIEHKFHTENDAGHGRMGLDKWDKLQKIIIIKTKRELKGKTTEDTRFYIISCNLDAKSLLNAIRKHWQIENCLHWTLDVTFNENSSRVRKDSSPENYAMLRHIALNILSGYKSIKASVKRKINMASLDDEFRSQLIKQII